LARNNEDLYHSAAAKQERFKVDLKHPDIPITKLLRVDRYRCVYGTYFHEMYLIGSHIIVRNVYIPFLYCMVTAWSLCGTACMYIALVAVWFLVWVLVGSTLYIAFVAV
jgi:hypothetical protein